MTLVVNNATRQHTVDAVLDIGSSFLIIGDRVEDDNDVVDEADATCGEGDGEDEDTVRVLTFCAWRRFGFSEMKKAIATWRAHRL